MGPTSTRSSSVRGLAAVLIGLLLLSAAVQGQGEGGKPIGDRKCFLCHQDHKKSYPLSIHGSLGGEKDSTSCEACHGPGREHMLAEGDVEKIVVFEKLTPTESSRRCLTCHEKDAKKGGHIDGFIESSYLAKGLGCTSCHKAHAPAAAAAPEAKKPSKRIGTAACLVCHSDYREYPHREQAEEALGCETCHGPGRAHAEARGDASLIRNPARLEAPASDKSCVLCHSDMTAPDHPKEPVEGKNRCVDCHGIHKEEPEATAAEEPLPGKPPFRIETVEEVAAPTAEPRSLMTPSVPAPEEDGVDLFGLKTSGSARFGYRFVDEQDNERMYDQDYGFDEGFRLFEFEVAGQSIEDPGLRFSAEGSGVDDPVETYGLQVQQKDLWSFSADWTRTNLVFRATGDPREQSSRRDRFGAEFSWLFTPDLRLTAGAELWWREGDMYGARLVSGSTLASHEPFDEDGGIGYLQLDWVLKDLKVTARQGYRWEDIDSDIDAGRPAGGAGRSLDHDQKTDVTAPITTVMAEYMVQEGLIVDAKVAWSPVDTDTDTLTTTTGPGTGAGVTERTEGDVDGDRDFFRGEVGAVWIPLPELSVRFRFEGFWSDDDTDGDFRTRVRPAGSASPTTTTSRDDYERELERFRVRGEAEYQVFPWGSALAGFEWMTEDYDLTENGDKDSSDSDMYGPILGFEIDPTDDLHIEALYRFVSVTDPYTEVGTEDEDEARLRVRYRPSERVSLAGFATYGTMTNQRHDTRIQAWSTGLSTVLIPFDELVVEAGYDYQVFDTETEDVRFRGGVPGFGTRGYDRWTQGGNLSLFWEVTPLFRMQGGVSFSATEGDDAYTSVDSFFGLAYDLRAKVTIGSDFRWVKYNEENDAVDDYQAWIIETWLKVGF